MVNREVKVKVQVAMGVETKVVAEVKEAVREVSGAVKVREVAGLAARLVS